jgi:TolB-like protein/Flp pilus assembly protein TadD
MFTDMVGYTSLSQNNEALGMELLEEHRKILRPFFPRHNGKEVKTMGDAFLVEFASALEAVRCAFDIQQSLHELNANRTPEHRIMLRIGIHLGDVIHSRNDVYGDAVNVASRIEPLALSGGICITEQVYGHIRNKFEFPIVEVGDKILKNVQLPMRIYEIKLPWEREAAPQHGSLDKRRVAVMPLVNMISDPNEEYFADGMTEELTSAISKLPELNVISRTSAMHYKNQSKRVSEICKELNVGTLLEGSVRKAGNRVRIAVQLIDAENDKHLWSENYDRTLEDVFSIQSEIAQSVAEVLKVRLLKEDRERIQRTSTTDTEAHTLYLKGLFHINRLTEEELREAIRCFEGAIEKDPEYALAYTGLADAIVLLGFFEMAPSMESFRRGERSAMKALAIDTSLAEEHLYLGFALLNQWDFKRAEMELGKAAELNTNLADAHLSKAALLVFKRRFDEALPEIERALDLDPLSALTLQPAATLYLYSGHYDEAIRYYRKALELDPKNAFVRNNLGLAYVRKGMIEVGLSQIQKAGELLGVLNPSTKNDLAWALAKAGRIDEVWKILSELLEWRGKHGGGAAVIAGVYSNLGEIDKAFEWLEKAYEEHSGYLLSAAADFTFEKLHSDPRFQALMKRMGLVE